MIYDRTKNDVEEAKKIRDEYVKKFKNLTEKQINQLERGFLTHNTLNRIENKQSEIETILDSYCYFAGGIINKTWEIGDIFLQSDFERLLNNLKMLVNAFFVYANTPIVPSSRYIRYSTINDIEKILVDLEDMTKEIKTYYRECGNFECGGD